MRNLQQWSRLTSKWNTDYKEQAGDKLRKRDHVDARALIVEGAHLKGEYDG